MLLVVSELSFTVMCSRVVVCFIIICSVSLARARRFFKGPPSFLLFNSHGALNIIRLSSEQSNVAFVERRFLLDHLDLLKVFLLCRLFFVKPCVDVLSRVLRQLHLSSWLAGVMDLMDIVEQRFLHSSGLTGKSHSCDFFGASNAMAVVRSVGIQLHPLGRLQVGFINFREMVESFGGVLVGLHEAAIFCQHLLDVTTNFAYASVDASLVLVDSDTSDSHLIPGYRFVSSHNVTDIILVGSQEGSCSAACLAHHGFSCPSVAKSLVVNQIIAH